MMNNPATVNDLLAAVGAAPWVFGALVGALAYVVYNYRLNR